MTKKYIKSETTKVKAGSTVFEFTCHYPEENPEGAVGDIVKVMKYVGLFEGMSR